MIVMSVPMISYFSIIYIRLTVSLVLSWLPWGPFTLYILRKQDIVNFNPLPVPLASLQEVLCINYISVSFRNMLP